MQLCKKINQVIEFSAFRLICCYPFGFILGLQSRYCSLNDLQYQE